MQSAFRIAIFAATGALGGLSGSLLGEIVQSIGTDSTALGLVSTAACWLGAISAAISAAFLLTHRLHQRQWLGTGPLAVGVLSGLAAGMVSGAIAQMIYLADSSEHWRIFCWGIAGCLIGFALSWHVPNVSSWRGALGGAIGGWVGAALFVMVNVVLGDNVLARYAGATLIGFFISGMLAVAETTLRRFWIEVRYPDGARRDMTLGGAPVVIGGDKRRATVFDPKLAGTEVRYRMAGGKPVREDGVRRTVAPLKPGATERIGRLTITLRGRT